LTVKELLLFKKWFQINTLIEHEVLNFYQR